MTTLALAPPPKSQLVPVADSGHTGPPPEHRWKPGQSGNPSGRPKNHVTVTGAALRIIGGQLKPPKPELALTWQLAHNWLRRALRKTRDLEVLLERTEGKVTQPIVAEESVKIRFVYDKLSPAEVSGFDDGDEPGAT